MKSLFYITSLVWAVALALAILAQDELLMTRALIANIGFLILGKVQELLDREA
jgi:hypothetical protein